MNKRLFAIGDIHGCFNSLKVLVEHKIQLQKNDKLILLGDFIDRGAKSKEVVDFIIELQEKGYDIIPLLGNHEAMLLDAYKNEKYTSLWIQNGGTETLKSFEISSLEKMEQKYIKLFKGLRYYYSLDEYLFVHAGFNDTIAIPFDDKYSMLWYCKESYSNPLLINKIIIHGHCPISISKCKDRVRSEHSTINIDTACVYRSIKGHDSGLTAYECNTKRIYSV